MRERGAHSAGPAVRASSRCSRSIAWSRTIAASTKGPSDMCGIAGVFSGDRPLPPGAPHTVKAMNDAMAHRGPDGDGFYEDAHAALGHRRLAIIDRARGHQPMAN